MANWVDDVVFESNALRYGLEWTKETVHLKDLNRKRSLENKGRIGVPLVSDTVDEYALAMLDGAKFPRVVLRRDGDQYVVISGNHRCEAAKEAGAETVDAYILKTTDSQIMDILPRECNAWIGVRPSTQERLHQAAHAVATYGWSHDRAAKAMCVSRHSLANFITANAMRARLASLGVNSQPLSQEHMKVLNKFNKNDNVLAAVAALGADFRLNRQQLQEEAKAVAAKGTELRQLAAVNEARERLAKLQPVTVLQNKMNIRTRFLRLLSSLESVLTDHPSLSHLQVTEMKEVECVQERLHKLSKVIQGICKGIGPAAGNPRTDGGRAAAKNGRGARGRRARRAT